MPVHVNVQQFTEHYTEPPRAARSDYGKGGRYHNVKTKWARAGLISKTEILRWAWDWRVSAGTV